MKKIITAIAAVAATMITMVSCLDPVESSFSVRSNYLYTVVADFGEANTRTEIGLPNVLKAQQRVDSVLLSYITKNKLGGVFSISAAGHTQGEMQNMLNDSINKIFTKFVKDVDGVDFTAVLDECKYFWGGSANLVCQVTQVNSHNPIRKDTIVENQRVNFTPADESYWETKTDGETYYQYTFDENNIVVLLYAGGDEPTTYTVDPLTGVYTVAAVNVAVPIPTHTLAFKMSDSEPCLLSSMNDQLYFLKK